jgi:hypothetical protein
VRRPRIIEETFGDILSVKKTLDVIDIDKQFDDIIEYSNDPDGRIGLDKCIEGCHGYCVEYGMTGDAHCYPVKAYEEKNFYGNVVPNEVKLSYPNVE